MKPLLQKLSLAKKYKMILRDNKIQKLTERKWPFILKVLTQLKIETKYIQNNGGLSTKLYNNIFKEYDIFPDDFIEKCKNNAN